VRSRQKISTDHLQAVAARAIASQHQSCCLQSLLDDRDLAFVEFETVLGAEKTVAAGTGLARERRLLITGEPPKQAEDRKKPNPSACTGLAEHLLLEDTGLFRVSLRGRTV